MRTKSGADAWPEMQPATNNRFNALVVNGVAVRAVQ